MPTNRAKYGNQHLVKLKLELPYGSRFSLTTQSGLFSNWPQSCFYRLTLWTTAKNTLTVKLKAIGAVVHPFKDWRGWFTNHRNAAPFLPEASFKAVDIQKCSGDLRTKEKVVTLWHLCIKTAPKIKPFTVFCDDFWDSYCSLLLIKYYKLPCGVHLLLPSSI